MKLKHAPSGLILRLLALCLAAFDLAPVASAQAANPTFQLLLNFSGPTTGASPVTGLMQGRDGSLYGTAQSGGSGGYGTVFKLKPDGTGFAVLHNFAFPGTNGGDPTGGLIQGTDGNLYGTTTSGGSSFYGTVFKLEPDGTGFAVLLNFDSSTTGSNPDAGLIQLADGNLYGTAYLGGSNGRGTLFKLKPNGSGFAVLQNFDLVTTGGGPVGLIQGTDGNLYGTNAIGGSNSYGTVFKLKPDGTGFTVLLNFDYFTTGAFPSKLIQGTDGNLYGTASYYGSGGLGTVFKLKPDGTGFAVLHNFGDNTNGAYPYGGLIQGTDGNLYGTTSNGGSNGGGTVFSLKTDGTGFAVLENFYYPTTGGYPLAGLIQGTDGNLYGTTEYGGSNNFGTVFRLVFPSIQDRKQAVEQALSALLPSGNKDTDKGLQSAIASLASSLNSAFWVDGNNLTAKDGQKVFDGEKQAVQALIAIWNDKKTPAKVVAAAADAIDKLVIIDIDLATTAIADAMTGGGNGQKLAEATKELANAAAADQADLAAEAIDHARNAWQKAQDSLKK